MFKEKVENWSKRFNIPEFLYSWEISSYNENSDEELNYFLNPKYHRIDDIAYLYDHANQILEKMRIVSIISRNQNPFVYDQLVRNDDILIAGEKEWKADTSAEFIFDNDCCMVWFKKI